MEKVYSIPENVYLIIRNIDKLTKQISGPHNKLIARLNNNRVEFDGKILKNTDIVKLLNDHYLQDQKIEEDKLKTERSKLMHDLRVEFEEFSDED